MRILPYRAPDHTVRRASTLEQFSEVFLGRIDALTSIYAPLSRERGHRFPLREILAQAPHRGRTRRSLARY
jgi:HWE histidine kinase